MTGPDSAFAVQKDVRGPWRAYLDSLIPLRPSLHRYCCRLTGNVWDGEDLVQDALIRVFSLLGKIDADLSNPRAYLIRTATHLWIDRERRRTKERALLEAERPPAVDPGHGPESSEVRRAASALLERLPPRERAAVLLKDVFDLSLEETASMLKTSVGAVKAALHRGRGRLSGADRERPSDGPGPSRELVERFVAALGARDLDALQALCAEDVSIELVGGAELEGFGAGRVFFEHAHLVVPSMGTGEKPRWETRMYDGEPIALGFRTLGGVEGLNEVHRLAESEGRISRIRCYCFAPDTLRTLAEHLGIEALGRRYRSPS